jgi:alpha-tubulin suppressor-like RCC1 family protein
VGGGFLFKSVVAGHATTCGVAKTGVGKCWGTLLGPINGAGTPTSTTTPTTVRVNGNGDSLWSSIARPSMSFACASNPGRTLFCWGDGTGGRLGNGTTGIQAPAPITSAVLLSAVAVGEYFACGLASDRTARCWGGSYGAGPGGTCSTATPVVCSATPLPATGDYQFTELSAGPQHICGVLSDRPETRCWGNDFDYAVGEGSPPFAVSVPYPVIGSHPFTSVSAGDQFSCGLASDRNVWCWGSNRSGQLGQHPLEGRIVSLFNARVPVVVAATISTLAR